MKFTEHKSIDELFEDLGSAMKAADSKVKPWQENIKAGDFYIQDTEYGFRIYGEILKTDEPIYKEPHMKHYRLVEAYSIACSDGEKGDVHVSSISALISKEDFEIMKAQGWLEENEDA